MYPTRDQPWRGRFVAEQIDDIRERGIDVDVYSFDGRRDKRAYARAAAAIRRSTADGNYDLVHAHYGLTGAVALAQRSRPVVTTFWGSDVAIGWQRAVSRVVARTTTPIVVAECLRKALRLNAGDVIPSAVDTELFTPIDRVEARRALGWDTAGPCVLLPASRANPVKRADVFDAALCFARQEITGLVGKSLDGLRRQDVPVAMSAADVILLTSDSEGSPVAVKEALACETPVIATEVGDVAELLAGLPMCGTAAQDPRALARLVAHAVGAERTGALRTRALEFSRDRIADKVVAVYRGIAAGASPEVERGL